MFDNIIEFISHKDYVDFKEDYPTPIKLNIPEWYKKLDHTITDKTVKGCMPFLDTLTTGYLMRVAQDYGFKFNEKNEKGNRTFEWHPPQLNEEPIFKRGINLNGKNPEVHPPDQIKGSPHLTTNQNMPVLKIMNPWIIKTPPGYSCLFVPPLNNTDDRFSIIPGIVDTDTFPNEINFPILMNGDKHPELDTVIKKGTPFVQVIPFKREPWKMKIKSYTTKELEKSKMFYMLKLLHVYKSKFWKKKKWS